MKQKIYSFRKFLKNIYELNEKAIIIPTDTVIGILSKDPKLIYEIKKRPLDKPLVKFVNHISEIIDLLPHETKVLEKYWPGTLTIIKNEKAYRIPNSKKIWKLIQLTGPLYSSSANISNEPTITNTKQAARVFYSDVDKFVVIKGRSKDDYPSTIVDFDNFTILRRGRIDGQEVINDLKMAAGGQM